MSLFRRNKEPVAPKEQEEKYEGSMQCILSNKLIFWNNEVPWERVNGMRWEPVNRPNEILIPRVIENIKCEIALWEVTSGKPFIHVCWIKNGEEKQQKMHLSERILGLNDGNKTLEIIMEKATVALGIDQTRADMNGTLMMEKSMVLNPQNPNRAISERIVQDFNCLPLKSSHKIMAPSIANGSPIKGEKGVITMQYHVEGVKIGEDGKAYLYAWR